jgi:two-component system, LytTR family, sensor kinase
MTGKYKIIFSLSFALAIFYSLPWIALGEQGRMAGVIQHSTAGTRVFFLFVTIFSTSVLFFFYNFFWKHRLLPFKTAATRQLLNIFFNVLLVVVACGVLIVISTRVFTIGAARAFFIFYLFRNTGIILIVMLVTYVVELVEKSRQNKIEILTLQHQHAQTELAALRAQIDPHFLFNSLASLSGLIRANSKDALAFVDHLSETFRYILENRQHKLVTVKDELQFLESYVFMIKKRFAGGFNIITKIDEGHVAKNIPQFALQITVENAIKHNLVSVKNPLTVEIISGENALLVRNNLQHKKSMPGYGIGLANLSKQYQIISSQDITISKDAHHFEIELPLL